MTEQELEYYYEGIDCTCNAYSANECACDVDWTPKEVYVLRQRIAELEKINANQCKLLEFYANDYQSRKQVKK